MKASACPERQAQEITAINVALVAAVLHMGHAAAPKVFLHIGARAAQKRADDVSPPRGNARKSGRAGTAAEVQKHRFGVVVGGVHLQPSAAAVRLRKA